MKKVKVLMLSWEYPPRIIGGISRHVRELSSALVKNDIDVTVVTLSHPDSKSYEIIDKVKIVRVRPNYIQRNDFLQSVAEFNFTLIEGALSLIKSNNIPDIIHCHDWLVAYSGFVLKYGYRKPLLVTIHATEHGRNSGIYNDIQKYIHQIEYHLTYEAWRVITCSEFMKEEVIRVFNLPQDKVITIPNGINKDKYNLKFDKEVFRKNYADDNEKIIFYVGRMVREKGVDILIEAIPKVLQEFPNAKFLIVGGGYIEHLKQKAIDLGIYDKIYFTGYVNDETLMKIYNIIDVAVFPSLYEPFGIVALEAMAAKVPVVVSDIGGFKEIVSHNIDGIHTWANNPSSLAWGILEVLKNKTLSNKLVNNAYKKIENLYNWDTIAKKTKELYETVIDEYLLSGWGKQGKWRQYSKKTTLKF